VRYGQWHLCDTHAVLLRGGLPGAAAAAILIDEQGWRVRLEATGKKPELRADPDISVIGSRVEGFAEDPDGHGLFPEIDGITPLTRVLLRKAGHGYQIDDRPFMIAVLCAGELVDDHDIAQALFGRIEYAVSMSSDRAARRYLPGGLWHEEAGPRYTDVSAVLTASNLSPSGVAAVNPCLWLNPAATHPLDAVRRLGSDGKSSRRGACWSTPQSHARRPSWKYPHDGPQPIDNSVLALRGAMQLLSQLVVTTVSP
jgi:hypothetical protein